MTGLILPGVEQPVVGRCLPVLHRVASYLPAVGLVVVDKTRGLAPGYASIRAEVFLTEHVVFHLLEAWLDEGRLLWFTAPLTH